MKKNQKAKEHVFTKEELDHYALEHVKRLHPEKCQNGEKQTITLQELWDMMGMYEVKK